MFLRAQNGVTSFIPSPTPPPSPTERASQSVLLRAAGFLSRWSSLTFAVAMALSLIRPATAAAEPVIIASAFIEAGGEGGGAGFLPDLVGRFTFEASAPESRPQNTLFNAPVTSADVGRTFRASAATDPAFAVAAEILANGRDSFVTHAVAFDDGFGSAVSLLESQLFRGRPTEAPDLVGFSLTAMIFRLDRLSVVEVQNQGRSVEYAGLLTFEGTAENGAPVPEPATVLLFATGAAAIGRRAWKREGA